MNQLKLKIRDRTSSRILLVALLLQSTLIGTAGPARGQSAPASSVDAATLIEQIKNEIQEARKLKTRPTLNIKTVAITLKTIAEQSADGGVKFVVPILPVSITTSGELKNTTTQTISFTFKPEGPLDIGAPSNLGLADAINAAKLVIQKAMSSEPHFKLEGLVYGADFVLKTDAKGGGSIWLFDVGTALSQSATQHLSVEFSPAETP
jgi:hypothetical protein